MSDRNLESAWRDELPAALRVDLPRLATPSVSIVINNYNYGRYLEQALRSAVGQTRGCEVVVVDDGSTDESSEVLARWAGRVKMISQPNSGQLVAYQTGFHACSGDIVIFLDSDDMLEPRAVELVSKAFDENVVKLQFRLRLVDDQGQPLGPSIPRVLDRGDMGPALALGGVLYASAPGSGNAYRRTVLDRLFPLPIDPLDRHAADFFCAYGSALFGRIAALDTVLGSYRVHRAAEGNEHSALMFGNAEHLDELRGRLERRALRFKRWVAERTGGVIDVPAQLRDFSLQKVLFAAAIMGAPTLLGRLSAGGHEMKWLLRSLWERPRESLAMKVALTCWAFVLMLSPRAVARPLANYVCNPATR